VKGKLTGRGILIWLGGFFGVIVAVNVVFIWTSIATYRGEDEQKPYLQGIEFNHTLERRAEQAKLGWTSHIAAQRLASGAVEVIVTLKDASGAPQSVSGLYGELRHPADENRDRALHLVERAKGEYLAQLSGVKAGAWDVMISTPSKDLPFEASERLWVR
jgi:nitrogen fixation protein FixH